MLDAWQGGTFILLLAIAALLAFLSASILAAIILVPDVVVQSLFILPVGLYLLFAFRGLSQKWINGQADQAQDQAIGHVLLPIDLIAIICGIGLAYLGVTAQFYTQFEGEAAGDFPLSLVPTVDIPSLVAGSVLVSIGIGRTFLRNR